MPYEMEAFVDEETDLTPLFGGGDLDTLKAFISPVSRFSSKRASKASASTLDGHYEVINGYDDAKGCVCPGSYKAQTWSLL